MKKLWLYIGVLAALILSGCGTPPPDFNGQDWCYVFDFTENQQGFAIAAGTWTAQGITSDTTGLLQTSFVYDRDVYPNYITVKVFRPTGITGDITATVAGVAFGLSTYFTGTLPSADSSAELRFAPPANGEEIIGDRNSINITVDGNQPIGIESIDVRGMGGTPFPYNPCSDATSTPIPENTGTGTPAGTATPTASATAGPSPTPGDWSCFYDFTIDDYTFTTDALLPGTYDGSGWHSVWNSGSGYRGIILKHPESLLLTHIVVDFHRVAGTSPADPAVHAIGSVGGATYYTLPYDEAPPEPLELTGDLETFSGTYIQLFSGWGASDPGGSVDIYNVLFEGTGTPPVDCPDPTTPTPTTTPTLATPTPGPTNTQEPLWSACIDFTASRYSFTAVGAEYEDERGFIQDDPDEWSVGRSGLAPTAKKKVKLQFGAGQSFSGDIRFTDNGSNATSWLTVAGNEVFLDYSVSAWLPTSTFWIEFDGGFDGLILERVCWMDPNPSTGTPIPGTLTPVGTRTPLPTVTGSPAPSRTPVVVPPPVILITSTSGIPITATFMWGGTPTFAATGTPITGTPAATGTPAGTGAGGAGGAAGEAGEILGFGWQIGWGMFGALFAYVQQATDMVGTLLSSFANATPVPIPGLPLCMSNPQAHDICAIYYIMDWTLFAPGTPGALIIPLILIIMNVSMAIRFIRWVLKIVRRGEETTHVE